LIFCRTKNDVDFVTSKLIERGYDAEGLHGDISQTIREKILNKFRKKLVNILVATDVAARGLDIEDLTHVINYSLPQDPESYLHRIGRTGRAGKEGTAITFVTPEEFRKLNFIKNITQTNIRKERIPQIQEVIEFKKRKIISEVNDLVEYGTGTNYLLLAKDLLRNHNAEEVVAALVKYNFQDELEEKSYAKIHDLYEHSKRVFSDDDSFSRKGKDSFRENRSKREKSFTEKGKVRMFLALGKYDDLDVKGLLKMLKKETGIAPEKISGVQISDAFSFFNVSEKEADLVLKTLNKDKKARPIVERAKTSR
jgi:ATP-dependent RNA helicase DeaD